MLQSECTLMEGRHHDLQPPKVLLPSIIFDEQTVR